MTQNPADFNAIQQLLAEYTWSHDSRDFDKLATCFTDDAQYTMQIAQNAPGEPVTGGKAIASLVKKFKSTQTDQRRHLITNIIVDKANDTSAIVKSYVTVFATEGDFSQLITTGQCVDEVEKQTDGHWKFTRKAMHLDKGF